MLKPWEQNGRLIVDAQRRPIECSVCPCPPPSGSSSSSSSESSPEPSPCNFCGLGVNVLYGKLLNYNLRDFRCVPQCAELFAAALPVPFFSASGGNYCLWKEEFPLCYHGTPPVFYEQSINVTMTKTAGTIQILSRLTTLADGVGGAASRFDLTVPAEGFDCRGPYDLVWDGLMGIGLCFTLPEGAILRISDVPE